MHSGLPYDVKRAKPCIPAVAEASEASEDTINIIIFIENQ